MIRRFTCNLALLCTVGAAVTACDSKSGEEPAVPNVTREECGAPTFERDSGLRRLPYLQDVRSDQLRVVFTSTNDATGRVEYAASPEGPWTRVDGVSEEFPISRTDDEVDYTAWETRIEGLEDGRTYCYRVLLDEEVVASGLTMSTAFTDEERPVRILAIGDSGNGSEEQEAVRDEFIKHEYDLFLHLGDMAYGSGTYVEFETRMFQVYEDFLHGTPSWPTMGNHEFKTNMGEPYLNVYYLPEVARADEDQERYYSFDYGNVHFVSVDSNEFPLGLDVFNEGLGEYDESMLQWLREDLANSDADWKIAFFHHPAYTSSGSREASHLVRNSVLPILEEGGVDLALAGHDHFYERSQPIWQNEVDADNPNAITYIIAGFGGTGMTDTVDGQWHSAVRHDESQGFVDLTIAGCTTTATVIDLNGTEVDSFSLNGCD